MRQALADDKAHTEFEILHVVRPNTSWDQEKLDWRRYPIAERYLSTGERSISGGGDLRRCRCR
jgi:hypothetical protein